MKESEIKKQWKSRRISHAQRSTCGRSSIGWHGSGCVDIIREGSASSSTHKYTALCLVFIAIAIQVKMTSLMVFSRLEAQAWYEESRDGLLDN